MVALDGLVDLTVVAAWLVALALAYLAYQLARAVVGGLDVSILGVRPFHGLAVALENSVVTWFGDAVQASEAGITRGLSGLFDSFAVLLGIPILLYLGVKNGLGYLWSSALGPRIEAAVRPVRTVAANAFELATAAAQSASDGLATAEGYASTVAGNALSDAWAYTDTRVSGAVAALRSDFAAGLDELRSAEDAALTHALQITQDGIAAATQAAALAETAAEGAAAAALAKSETVANAALADVSGIAVGAEHDLQELIDRLNELGLAGLVAAVPALATLLTLALTESGLDDAACRGKVKQVCGTDPGVWSNLLGLLAPLGFAFTLAELLPIARKAIEELTPVIREAA